MDSLSSTMGIPNVDNTLRVKHRHIMVQLIQLHLTPNHHPILRLRLEVIYSHQVSQRQTQQVIQLNPSLHLTMVALILPTLTVNILNRFSQELTRWSINLIK